MSQPRPSFGKKVSEKAIKAEVKQDPQSQDIKKSCQFSIENHSSTKNQEYLKLSKNTTDVNAEITET
jgi:hypothetical protein